MMAGDCENFEFCSHTRLVVGAGSIVRLGELGRELVREMGGSRALLVSDPGVAAAGHAAIGIESLVRAGLEVECFSEFGENPTTTHVDAGAAFARDFAPDLIVGLGGGSSMDCAKGINFLFSCGGTMHDYQGRGRATGPMLPSIAVPTTAGTGSETQSFALISDPESGRKMACGDSRAAFRTAILDVTLTLTQPARVAALTGIDAISHAIESHVSRAATPASRIFSLEAWRLLSSHLPRVFAEPDDVAARSAVQLGAAWAGLAIENAMLGAAHALANPLTAMHGVVHGQAVGLMLPHVVRFNAAIEGGIPDRYAELEAELAAAPTADGDLGLWLGDLLRQAGLATSLGQLGLGSVDVAGLAAAAASQWTAGFNPRPVAAHDLMLLYEAAR